MKKYVLIIILLLVGAKLFYWLGIFPNADEAYYWLWGRRPALSYHDHPGLQAWTQGIFYEMFGRSLFVLRLPAFLCSLVLIGIYHTLIRKLNYGSPSFQIITVILITPIFFVFTSFVWNDYMMITMATVSLWFWLNYLFDVWNGQRGQTADILLAFLFLGLAGISKYNSVFVAGGIFSAIVSNRRLYPVFKDYRLYLGIFLAALVISPIFIWNAQNAMGSYEFNIQQRVMQPFTEKFFRGNIWGFLGGSLLMLSPFVIYAIIRTWKKPLDTAEGSFNTVYRTLAKHVFLISTAAFLFLSLFANVLYYWNIVAYLLIIPIAADYLIKKRLLAGTLIFAIIVNILIVFHFGVLPLNVLSEGAEDRDGVHHYGWDQISETIEQIQDTSQYELQLLTSSYRTSALLAFKTDNIDVYAYSPRFDQFDHWNKGLKFDNDKALILTGDWKPLNAELKEVCQDILPVDTVRIQKWGFPIKEYYLYIGTIQEAFRE
jgi:4-amino-4-deoxy-L-arabinose transferase-like glycosyltransferase